MVDYFTEIFPIDTQQIGRLHAYKVVCNEAARSTIVPPLLSYLNAMSTQAQWVYLDSHLISDATLSDEGLTSVITLLKERFPKAATSLSTLAYDANWQPTRQLAADYVVERAVLQADDDLRQVLRAHANVVGKGYVMRDYHVQGWVMDKTPALSFTVQPRTVYIPSVQEAIVADHDVIGMQAIDKTRPYFIGTIQAHIGSVADHRERLEREVLSTAMKDILGAADDADAVLRVSVGDYSYDVVASALNLVLTPAHYPLFELASDEIEAAYNLPPDATAGIVSQASDILKNYKLIGSGYNNRTHGDHFIYLQYMPDIAFKDSKVRPYKREKLAQDFIEHGLFATKKQFKEDAIRIAVINALDDPIATDFVEAMRRQLERDFGLTIEMIKERTVRVVSEANLASAVRVVEKEAPHVLLGCFADADTHYYEHVKSLTLGRGIALQALYESTMHDPEAMGMIIMGVLAKTGNIPYVLAEKLDAAELVVGLDWVRQTMTRGDRVVGMSRIYRRDGTFMRYFMDVRDIDSQAPPPLDLIAGLFPEVFFKGKRVVVHHHGKMPETLLDVLAEWSNRLGATFLPVEITTDTIPHIYALDDGIARPPWGSACLLNNNEALVVSSSVGTEHLPMPIHIRLPWGNIALDAAIYSVLAFTLLNYGTTHIPRSPVTIQNADRIAEWLARGMLPDNSRGDVPFWL